MGQAGQSAHDRPQPAGIVDVLLAVQRGQIIGPRRRSGRRRDEPARAGEVLPDGVHHDVAHPVDAAPDALGPKVAHGGRRRAEEEPGDVIGQPAVDLLRHARIEAAQARLHVGDRDAELGRCHRPGQGRVGVPEDEHQLRSDLEQGGLEGLDHPARHPAVRARSDAEVPVGRGDAQLVEEGLRHLVVVVLAGVDEHFAHPPAQGAREGGRLDELRAGPDYRHHDRPRPAAAHQAPTAR